MKLHLFDPLFYFVREREGGGENGENWESEINDGGIWEAQAVGEGTTQVFFECSSLKLQTTVIMRKRKIVLVDAPIETLTNAPIPTTRYNFSVNFSSDTYSHDLEVFMDDLGILFDYRMDPHFVGVSDTICFEVKGHETIYFSSHQCFIARN